MIASGGKGERIGHKRMLQGGEAWCRYFFENYGDMVEEKGRQKVVLLLYRLGKTEQGVLFTAPWPGTGGLELSDFW